MTSIRKRLLISILAVLALATFAVGIATYLGIRHEMDELYDGNMRQLAIVASNMVSGQETPSNIVASTSQDWPRGEEMFLIQVWKDDKLVYSSHPVVGFVLQGKSGFGRVFFHDKKWHYYQEVIGSETVQVAQELSERRDVIREVYNAIIIPELIQFPLLFILVWLLVGYGLRPLERISGLIQMRTATFMQPIPLGEAPKEIHSLVVALNALLERLEKSMETQKRFTADAAHELRTPLTAVRLQLDLLQRAKADTDRHEAIETLERGVSRSIRLVHQLLELARQEPDSDGERSERFNLATIAKDVVHEQTTVAESKFLKIDTEFQDTWITGASSDLSILAGNILSNAIAYTGEHGRILLRTYAQEDYLVMDVADNGIGIAEADRERIFDRFYRVIGSNATGSGLGLSIVRTIAEKYGAKIIVSSGLDGKGTRFRVLFPKP